VGGREGQARSPVSEYAVGLSARVVEWFEKCRDEKLKRRIGALIDGL